MTLPGELPGVKKKSFAMYFGGGEIWFEHLDGIHEYTDLAKEKFIDDYSELNKPSKPSLVAINLDETEANDSLIDAIAEKLLNGGKIITRVVFVGTNRKTKHKLSKSLYNSEFAVKFINDFEKAKEWLVTEEV